MKTKSSKKQNLLLIGFLVAVLVLAAIFFTACMSDEEAFNKYGKANAFMTDSQGRRVHINANRVDFYIDSTVTGRYLTGVKHAIAQANSATNNLTVTANGNKYSRFSFNVIWSGTTEGKATALGYCSYWSSLGNITTAKIYLQDDVFKYFFYWGTSHIKNVALHELGHALGLDHVDSLPSNETVMESNIPCFVSVTAFTEFDLANLRWMYDQGGRDLYN